MLSLQMSKASKSSRKIFKTKSTIRHWTQKLIYTSSLFEQIRGVARNFQGGGMHCVIPRILTWSTVCNYLALEKTLICVGWPNSEKLALTCVHI